MPIVEAPILKAYWDKLNWHNKPQIQLNLTGYNLLINFNFVGLKITRKSLGIGVKGSIGYSITNILSFYLTRS